MNGQGRDPGFRQAQGQFLPNQVFGILRVAVTGQTVSPPLFESMEILGKGKVLERVAKAIEILERMGTFIDR